MFILVDLIVLIIVALFTFIGYKQGLAKAIIKLLSFFIAVVVALVLYRPISNVVIDKTQIDDNIKNTIIEKITPEGLETTEEVKLEDNLVVGLMGSATSTIEEIADAFSVKLIEICVLLLLFIVVRIALKFVTLLTDLITKIPVLKQVNEVGGLIYGLVKGIFIVYVLLAVIYLISPLVNTDITNTIESSFVTKHLYKNNIILNILM